ncbi:hypothetical protein D3C71_1531980 [compost metagenome]
MGEARIGVVGRHGLVADLPAQGGQLVQAEQRKGDAVEQARAAGAVACVVAGFGGLAIQELARVRLDAGGVLA